MFERFPEQVVDQTVDPNGRPNWQTKMTEQLNGLPTDQLAGVMDDGEWAKHLVI